MSILLILNILNFLCDYLLLFIYFSENLETINKALTLLPINIYLSKAIKRNTKKWCKICPESTTKTLKQRDLRHSSVFIVNFEQISHLFPKFLLLILDIHLFAGLQFLLSKASSFSQSFKSHGKIPPVVV